MSAPTAPSPDLSGTARPATWSRAQIVLHWVVALLVLAQYLFNGPIVEAWDALGRGMEVSPDPLVMGHVFGGIAILLLVIWRLRLRAVRPAPAPLGDRPVLHRVAALTHAALYGVLALLVLSGGMAWFVGFGPAAGVHGALRAVLLLLILLHVVGALWHAFVLRDGTMRRITRAE